ncbi:hypothetical protein FC92_GL000983 [Liquorilactobacillus hordei DSM 19519]|uniref:Uncharacterized protein n=2 Tax=Liquorilactobacillus hordei TaxID=468911 RepID=A0A0R1MIW7_9LACO|nr:hypothetical protein FC92_GL000983 [Liquorilactobacillus hordei DSM 19519]
MNVAYIEKSYREIIEDAEGNFTDYLQKIAPYKKYVFFSDSVFTDNESQSARSSFVVTDEIMNKWGGDHTEDEYFNLEASLQNLINIKVPNTTFELMRYRQNVKLEAALNESLAEGDSNSITKLRKAYSDDLKDLGLDTLLNSKDDGTQTLGERTKDWESHAPIPEPKGSEDVENIKEYIEKWFVVPMKRVFGVATEEEVDSLYDERKKEE